ncbi:MAG: polyphenol oxidase family protein [Candidatus Omnitrophica bacterium]|nr:polyphenol oxidase family protein [Candidatus Omnitrophota bacterium]
MPSVATDSTLFTPWQPGVWRCQLPRAAHVAAGITDRTGDIQTIRSLPLFSQGLVMADQVHGVSIASVDVSVTQIAGATTSTAPPEALVGGCDAMVTQTVGLGLAVRSADCLPLFVWDPIQRVVGVAHAGWRGLAGQLPLHLVSFVQQRYHARPEDLWVGIGPSIHACCYEVGSDFDARLTPWVQEQEGRRMCDLIACATTQLLEAGVRPGRVLESGVCTSCDPHRWFSLRREGEACGRLVSFIVMPSSPLRTSPDLSGLLV